MQSTAAVGTAADDGLRGPHIDYIQTGSWPLAMRKLTGWPSQNSCGGSIRAPASRSAASNDRASAYVAFGRIVVSEKEVPTILVNMI